MRQFNAFGYEVEVEDRVSQKWIWAGLFLVIHAISAEAQVTSPVRPPDPNASQGKEVVASRGRLYSAGVLGQLIGAGGGWTVGYLIGVDCVETEDRWCESPIPSKADASVVGAAVGAAIVPPWTVHLSNRPQGNLFETYLFTGVVTGLTAAVARKHAWLWYTIPVLQLVTAVETELGAQKRRH